MKICSKCKIEKPETEFHKNKNTKDGFNFHCKNCKLETSRSLRIKRKRGEATDREKAALKREEEANHGLKKCPKCGETKPLAMFFKDKQQKCGFASYCKECHSKKGKEYRSNNKDKCASIHRAYEIKNADQIAERKKKYYAQRKDKILARTKKMNKSPTKSKKLFEQLIITDAPQIDSKGFISVECYFCRERFRPTRKAVTSRIAGINGTTTGEHNFYCSNKCKKSCPTYSFKPHQQIDPRSKLYTPPTESQKARAAQTNDLKKEQCLEYGYNYCERCGDIINVDLHHTLPVSEYGMESVDYNSHMLLCPGCHVTLHRECA
jgi:hypothetical protein